jgi:AraC-like DNA-binding protein
MPQQFCRDPGLPVFESRRAQHSRACYRPHTHPTLSVGAVDAGASTLSVAGVEALPLLAGDTVLIPPGRVHACNPQPGGEWSYQMLYLDADWVGAVLRESGGDAGLACEPARYRDPARYRALTRLNHALHAPLEPEHKEALLLDFVGSLLDLAPDANADPEPGWLAGTVRRLDRECELAWPLERLAADAGLSRYHFIRAFRSHVGLTPHAFQLDCRINRARVALRAGAPLAELAQALGFSDQSHFQHAFKQRVAATPRQYRVMA